jgi:hypothetical protein
LKGNREPTKRRIGPFSRLSKAWSIVFASLLLDGLLAFRQIAIIPQDRAHLISIICLIITLPFLNQLHVSRFLAGIRGLQVKNRDTSPRGVNRIFLGFTVAGLILAKLLLLPSLTNFISLIVTAGLIFGIVLSARHFIQEANKHSSNLRKSPWLYIQLWERQMVILYCLPIFAARAVSLVGALSINSEGPPIDGIVYPLTSIILLLALKPSRSSFIGWCKRCKAPTPIAFADYGSCPACDEMLARRV